MYYFTDMLTDTFFQHRPSMLNIDVLCHTSQLESKHALRLGTISINTCTLWIYRSNHRCHMSQNEDSQFVIILVSVDGYSSSCIGGLNSCIMHTRLWECEAYCSTFSRSVLCSKGTLQIIYCYCGIKDSSHLHYYCSSRYSEL